MKKNNPETGAYETKPVSDAKIKAAHQICLAARGYEQGVLNTSELFFVVLDQIKNLVDNG